MPLLTTPAPTPGALAHRPQPDIPAGDLLLRPWRPEDLPAVRTDWSFDEAGLHRVWLRHSTANPASCRVARRAGLTAEGTHRGAARHADGWHDMHLHARLRTDT